MARPPPQPINIPYNIYIVKGSKEYYNKKQRITVEEIKSVIMHYKPEHKGYLWFDMLDFLFEPEVAALWGSHGFMNGIYNLLKTLPQEEPIANKLHLQMVISYFGNGAKGKIAELATPKNILMWVISEPMDVLKQMNIAIPIRTPEQIKEAKDKLAEEKKTAKNLFLDDMSTMVSSGTMYATTTTTATFPPTFRNP